MDNKGLSTAPLSCPNPFSFEVSYPILSAWSREKNRLQAARGRSPGQPLVLRVIYQDSSDGYEKNHQFCLAEIQPWDHQIPRFCKMSHQLIYWPKILDVLKSHFVHIHIWMELVGLYVQIRVMISGSNEKITLYHRSLYICLHGVGICPNTSVPHPKVFTEVWLAVWTNHPG